MRISRILHAGYVFESESSGDATASSKASIAFDPVFTNPFSRNCFALPSASFDEDAIRALDFSAVFISHFHEDHFCLESLNFLDRRTPIYLYSSHDSLFAMIRDLGFRTVAPLLLDEAVNVGPFRVTPRLALDPDVDTAFEIEAEGLRILNVVDAWLDPTTVEHLERKAPWDLVLWPFQTLRELEVLSPSRALPASGEIPHEWIEQLKALQPRFVVPSSCQFTHEEWSWYNTSLFPISYAGFTAQVNQAIPSCNVQRLEPSVSFMLDRDSICKAEPLEWIHPVGPQILDYHYRPNVEAPSTAQIASNFAPLRDEQTERVLNYCRAEIPDRYESGGPANDSYFNKARKWRLSLYDHRGQQTNFDYIINEGRISAATNDDKTPVGWLTEIPIAKFLAALDEGESLTSMYVRINDTVFEASIEAEIKSVDNLEDPLLRCLFNGVVGAYQAAQLARILKLGSHTP